MSCPVCDRPTIRRGRRALLTCGAAPCSTELRARRVRGNAYGNRGGGPGRSATANYRAVHARARRAFRGKPCDLADGTCRGRIEMALRDGLPAELLRTSPTGSVYYGGLQTEEGYRPLCRSHHSREGGLRGAARRSAAVAVAAALELLREHTCSGACAVCADLVSYDAAVARLHVHIVPRRPGDGLALPWTGQQS